MASPWPYPWNKNANPLAIPPGALRYQISLQKQASAQDSFGGESTSWTTVLTVMAAMMDINAREGYQPGQFVAEVTHRISIHWPGPDIAVAGGMRVLFGSRVFQIQAVENVQERNRVLHLKCLELNGVQ
jgi:SPP1 family predicted phage head-tail adaptor